MILARYFLTVVFALAIAGDVAPLRAQAPNKCRVADATSNRLIAELRDWMTTTDPERIADRDNIYKIPLVTTTQVTLLTDERICIKLVQAYASLSGGYTPLSLYVIKIGTKNYAVLDPTDLAGEQRTVMIFDSKYIRTGGWTGG